MDRTNSEIDTPVTQPGSRFELVSRLGNISRLKFDSHEAAAAHAKECFPDQEQDPDRTGAGWDVQEVGS